jgi:aminotransferase
MTRLSEKIGGVNLAQGLPISRRRPELTKALAASAAEPANHQYAFTWGSAELRRPVARRTAEVNGIRADPAGEVTITCGVSEAVAAAVLGADRARRRGLVSSPGTRTTCPRACSRP